MEAFFSAFTTVQGLIDLLTLIIMEIVLGIDNIIFIAIVTGFLSSKSDQNKARRLGLSFALIFRIALLFTLSYLAHLQEPFFTLGSYPVSGRGLVLLAGGMFLIIKTFNEIRHKFLIADNEESEKSRKINLFQAIIRLNYHCRWFSRPCANYGRSSDCCHVRDAGIRALCKCVH
jgi:predicted tellurium resistance membrane protein TerC